MADENHERIVYLNHILSRTKSRSKYKDQAPIHSGHELLRVIEGKYKTSSAIEYLTVNVDDDDADETISDAKRDFVRIRDMRIYGQNHFRYAALLFEYGDHQAKSLPVVHTGTFTGRELEGDIQEVGAACAHVLIRLPPDGSYDDGKYRCAIEYVNGGVTRKQVETLFRRQLKKHADESLMSFGVVTKSRGEKPKELSYRYHPSLELVADVGRKLGAFNGAKKILTSMTFTKRSEKLSTGTETEVDHADYEADVDVRVSAAQAPQDPEDKLNWFSNIRKKYETLGYKTQMFYRYAGGAVVKGSVNGEIAGAADFLMCPKETIYLDTKPRRWRENLDVDTIKKLYALINKDELWESGT